MRLIYHPHASRELIEAAQYYESRIVTLGLQFLEDADRAIAQISKSPGSWRVMDGEVRRYLMPRFPYAIYYRDYPDRIHIIAFKHHSRHPDYWRYRISN